MVSNMMINVRSEVEAQIFDLGSELTAQRKVESKTKGFQVKTASVSEAGSNKRPQWILNFLFKKVDKSIPDFSH